MRPGAVKLTHGLTVLPVSMSASALILQWVVAATVYGHVASCERLFALLETATQDVPHDVFAAQVTAYVAAAGWRPLRLPRP